MKDEHSTAILHPGFGNDERTTTILHAGIENDERQATFLHAEPEWNFCRFDFLHPEFGVAFSTQPFFERDTSKSLSLFAHLRPQCAKYEFISGILITEQPSDNLLFHLLVPENMPCNTLFAPLCV